MKTRVLAAGAVLVSAYVHLKLWNDGFRAIHVVGPAFLVNALAGVLIAVLLLSWRHWVPLFLTVGFGASTLGAFVTATTVGLFGVQETWTGSYERAAALSELVAVLAGLLALQREGYLGLLWHLAAGSARRGRPTSGRAAPVRPRSARTRG